MKTYFEYDLAIAVLESSLETDIAEYNEMEEDSILESILGYDLVTEATEAKQNKLKEIFIKIITLFKTRINKLKSKIISLKNKVEKVEIESSGVIYITPSENMFIQNVWDYAVYAKNNNTTFSRIYVQKVQSLFYSKIDLNDNFLQSIKESNKKYEDYVLSTTKLLSKAKTEEATIKINDKRFSESLDAIIEGLIGMSDALKLADKEFENAIDIIKDTKISEKIMTNSQGETYSVDLAKKLHEEILGSLEKVFIFYSKAYQVISTIYKTRSKNPNIKYSIEINS